MFLKCQVHFIINCCTFTWQGSILVSFQIVQRIEFTTENFNDISVQVRYLALLVMLIIYERLRHRRGDMMSSKIYEML